MNLNEIEIDSVPLKTILSHEVITFAPTALLSIVLLGMQSRSISSVVVIDEANKPVGIFTEQDAIKLMVERKKVSSLLLSDVMSQPVLTVSPNLGYGAAYQLMSEHRVRHLVVVDDDGTLIGLVSEGDFLHHMGMEYLVELKKVEGSMTQHVHTRDCSVSFQEVLSLMNTQRISCVVLTKDKKPVGILTERDMVKLASQDASVSDLSVSEQMTSPLHTVGGEMPLQLASRLMERNRIRRLVVVDCHGRLSGILTRHDIAKALQGSYIEYLQETLERKNKDLRHTEALLRDIEQKAFYQSLVEQISDAIFIIDADDGRILDANDQAARNLRMSMSELLEKRVTDFSLTMTSIDQWVEQHIPMLREKGEVLIETAHRRSDASVYPTEVKARLVTFGTKEYVVSVARDLTERVEANHRLKESEQRFRCLFMESPLAMAYVDHDGQLISLNNQFTEVFGYSAKDLPHIECWFTLAYPTPEHRGRAMAYWSNVFEDAKETYGLIEANEHKVCCKQGNIKTVRFSGMTTEQGFMAILEDITAQKQAVAALKESAETYFSVITTALDGFWIVDTLGKLVDVNESYVQMSGYSREELMAMHIGDLDAIETTETTQNRIQRMVAKGRETFLTKHRHKNGKIFDVEVNVTYWPGHGGQLFVFLRDVTQRIKDDDYLRQSAVVFDNTSEGVMITDPQCRIQMVNAAFSQLTGYKEDEVLGKSSNILNSGLHDKQFYAHMWQSINKTGSWQGEIWNRRKDGTTYPELLSISRVLDSAGRITHYVGVFADISRLKESEEKLSYLAHHDMLTGLPNRLMLQARLEGALGGAKRQDNMLALLLLDLDRFKDINDSFGHAAGDELLKQVSQTLEGRLRSADMVCRMGGDEFAILLEHISHSEDAGRVADDIIDSLSRTWNLSNGCDVSIGASIGISIFPTQSEDAEALLQHADAALYRAKEEGRGRFQYFTEALTRDARHRLELEARLVYGLAHEEMAVYYQPQIDINTGQVVGAEALVRWIDPERGVISPDQFIPLAEHTGLIAKVGSFVLQESCKQLTSWIEQGYEPISIAINLSPVQLRHSDIKEEIGRVLHQTSLPPELLEIEITESALIEREQESIDILNDLRSLGIRIAIDDFGTGYSSLAYLKKFPIDVLKIDKSFVDDIPSDKDDMVIASTIVAMGHSLGLSVLAEGVETKEQLEFLASKECNHYQGFLKSKPIPAHEFPQFLKKRSIS
ncbi:MULTISPECIES: EAL domain-containing protein [unclassified Neptuniibacter]|uniref:EAL domain-containing protein n=1 Tax=unclassified Neptuniibacter TaxID=2630693 RepID=UPI0025F1993D|nr:MULTISPECIES: EAL domain-containing protein [unclassified Neptuniibacter]|tara:strand:- start:1647 stop:5309 length:3663 start_codon:yes stop_codon:yes gene_type:complete